MILIGSFMFNDRPSLSLCMIVKNEEYYLPRFIKQHQGLFSEWIIVDTGSTDKTLEIIKEASFPTHGFEWKHNFAEARNYALSLCTNRWILALDADEFITKDDQEKILQAIQLDTVHALEFGIKNYIREDKLEGRDSAHMANYFPPDKSYPFATEDGTDYGYKINRLIRLFRSDYAFQWQSPIHETLETSRPDAKVIYVPDISIHHLGTLNREGKTEKKDQLYRDIANRLYDTLDTCNDPKLLFEAARFLEDPLKRLALLRKSNQLAPKDLTIKKEIANTFLQLGEREEALGQCRELVELGKEDLELHLAYAHCLSLSRGAPPALEHLKSQFSKFRQQGLYNYTLAQFHLQEKQIPQAFSYAQKACQLAPNSKLFHELLEQIKEIQSH